MNFEDISPLTCLQDYTLTSTTGQIVTYNFLTQTNSGQTWIIFTENNDDVGQYKLVLTINLKYTSLQIKNTITLDIMSSCMIASLTVPFLQDYIYKLGQDILVIYIPDF